MADRSDPVVAQVRALLDVARSSHALSTYEREKPLKQRQRSWQAAYRLEAYVRAVLGEDHRRLRLLAPQGAGLTAEGAALTDAATKLVRASDEFYEAVRGLGSRQTTVTLGCYPAHAPLIASASQQLSPEIDIQLVASDDLLRLDGGRNLVAYVTDGYLDAAIAPSGLDFGRLDSTGLYRWDLVAVVAGDHSLFGSERIQLQDLRSDYQLMASPPSHRTRDLLVENGLTSSVWFSSGSVDALCGLAEAGQGVAIVAGDSYPVRKSDPELSAGWPTIYVGRRSLGDSFDVVYRSCEGADPVSTLVSALQTAVREEVTFQSNRFVAPLPKRS